MSDEVVIGSLGVVGVTALLAGGYVNRYRNFVVGKTTGTTVANPPANKGQFGTWALAYGVLSLVLLAGSGNPNTRGMTQAFAGLIAGGMLIKKGPDAYANLKVLALGSPSTSSSSSSSSSSAPAQ